MKPQFALLAGEYDFPMDRSFQHICKILTFAGAPILLALGLCSTARASIEVQLRDRVVAACGVITLGDVAEIITADRQQARQLAATRLMPAPAPGTQRYLERREVEDLVAAQPLELRSLRFTGAARVAISRPEYAHDANQLGASAPAPMNRHAAVLAGRTTEQAAQITASRAEQLRAEVERAVEQHVQNAAEGAGEWRVACELSDRHLPLFDAATSPLVVHSGVDVGGGRRRFSICFHTPQGPVQVPVYADVALTSTPLVVAVRAIERGAVITAADVEVRRIEMLPRITERRRALDTIESLIGMEARQAIRAGEVVFSDQVQAPLVIKRGDMVAVFSQAGGIRVRTTAKARQDGARGELVQLESLDTRERFEARATGLREAAVFAQARPLKTDPAARTATLRR